ncbi:MAG: NUDIX hydrolase [Planctomycetota bacterium]|jgi:mutator protein MutT
MSDNFRYCPKCSAAALRPSSPKSIICSECGFEYFFNAAGAVAGLIVNEKSELLVTVRAHDPHKGQWDLPGGFIDPSESAEHALTREIKEEVNLDVQNMQYLTSAPNTYHYKQITYHTIDLAFVCHVNDFSSIHAKDDIAEALFLTADQIDLQKFPFPSIRHFIEEYLQSF